MPGMGLNLFNLEFGSHPVDAAGWAYCQVIAACPLVTISGCTFVPCKRNSATAFPHRSLSIRRKLTVSQR